MTEFYGTGLCINFNGTGGSIDLTADQRSVTFSPTIQMDDKSTGAEGAKSYLTRQTDFTVSYKGLYQSGTAAIGASVEDKLGVGVYGTLTIYPLGSTVAGNRIYTMPVISQGVQQSWGYTSLTELNVSFQGNGTITYGTI
jgi:hypothetical protein